MIFNIQMCRGKLEKNRSRNWSQESGMKLAWNVVTVSLKWTSFHGGFTQEMTIAVVIEEDLHKAGPINSPPWMGRVHEAVPLPEEL